MEPIQLEKIGGDDNCRNGDCTTVYRTSRGTVAVQGERLAHPIPDHEAIVEIPLDLRHRFPNHPAPGRL
jgi:hypothetical protein